MRRAVVALTGVVAGTTLLISLKSAPGASRLPSQVAADEAREAELAAAASPTPGPSGSAAATMVPSVPGVPALTPPPGNPGPAPQTQPQQPRLPTRPATQPAPTGTAPTGGAPIEGDSALTEFGYVTVAITVSNGRITDVIAVEMPSAESRSVALSKSAGPVLRQRALQAQGVHFDTVSGATWTSQAYQQSLGSAMAKAGLDASR